MGNSERDGGCSFLEEVDFKLLVLIPALNMVAMLSILKLMPTRPSANFCESAVGETAIFPLYSYFPLSNCILKYIKIQSLQAAVG